MGTILLFNLEGNGNWDSTVIPVGIKCQWGLYCYSCWNEIVMGAVLFFKLE